MTRRLAMFPLGTVLMPTQVLPLHIFEPRYRVLMEHLTGPGSAGEIGVVLIERGQEVGGGEVRTDTGTTARLLRADRLPDGRWVALFAGAARLRVAAWLPDDPYPRAEVDEIDDPPWHPADDVRMAAAEKEVRAARALAAELGEVPRPDLDLPPDPAQAAWELCAAAPLGALDRQRLLEAPGPAERLDLLARQASDAAAVLAFRLGRR